MNDPPLAERLEPLASELAVLLDTIATLTARADGIKADIRAMVPGPDTYTAGDLTVAVTSNGRVDPAKFAAAYPPDLFPDYYGTPALITKRVRDSFTTMDLEPFMAWGTLRVGLK